ncbi:putative oxidoreductase [Pseudonocardia sulfidoxydans NBRC 16205]|uniref:Putative oxidoreductase n=1 Tax=Pseudonocardia sulfidoxydans NBRC 16205 TaxID=1223511 RepID=A0A511DC10_9PSEU|nr:flavin reductase family protein [Pseudonocardia sulfidoxydans]GEL22339.1 putative oxidoreductase [Pseudonocardia sulfidoxydans NBRC 16205]
MSEPEPFHQLVGHLDYPMAIVTAADGHERSGCLVGFHTQCSIEPPRFLICISRRNHTFSVAARSAHLAVHFLDRADYALSVLFGEHTGDEIDKFARCAWREQHGVPVLTDVGSWFIGRVLERLPLGDHVGHLVTPVDGHAAGELDQLAFQQVKTMKPGHPS